MDDTRELLAEMAGIVDDICRNQARTLMTVAGHAELPEKLRDDIRQRARYMELSRHKIRKFIEKVRSTR